MLRSLLKNVHQSYFVVFMSAGIITGAIVGLVFRINFFASPIWILGASLLMIFAFLKPKFMFVIIAFIAGMILVFTRVATELEKQNVLGEAYVVSSGLETEAWVVSMRDFFAERIQRLLPETEASLGLSYLLGMKSGLPKELSENLRTVGLVHIVVASGAHLSILVEIAKKIFGKISRFAGLLFSMLFVVFFMAMVGWTPSILRAGIMAILAIVTWYYGRKIEPWRMILLVMATTLMMNPMFITNLGWLLSFASFTGIMILGPKMTRYFYGEKKPGFIAETVITTIAATLMTLPIILYYFGQVSLISVVANLLILPTLSYAMGLTFLVGVFAGVPWIEIAISFLATKLLDFHILVVEFFGAQTQFLVKISQYQWQIFLIYIPIVLIIIISHKPLALQSVKLRRNKS